MLQNWHQNELKIVTASILDIVCSLAYDLHSFISIKEQ